MSKLQELSGDFTQAHPETEVQRGEALSGESLRKFAEVLGDKVKTIRQREERSPADMKFISSVADLGTRNIAYVLGRGLALPPSPPSDQLHYGYGSHVVAYAKALTRTGHIAELQGFSTDSYATAGALETLITDDFASKDGTNSVAGSVATHATPMLAEIVDYNERQGKPLELDRYLEDNMRNMMAQYELHEQNEQHRAAH